MRLIIFEHEGLEYLYPLTYLRASFELRCGHSSLGEKICRAAGAVSETAYSVRQVLAPTVKQRFTGSKVNDPAMFDSDDLLLVDGRVLAPGKLPIPDSEGIIMHEGAPVLVKISASTAARFPRNDIGAFLNSAVQALPSVEKALTLIE